MKDYDFFGFFVCFCLINFPVFFFFFSFSFVTFRVFFEHIF